MGMVGTWGPKEFIVHDKKKKKIEKKIWRESLLTGCHLLAELQRCLFTATCNGKVRVLCESSWRQ